MPIKQPLALASRFVHCTRQYQQVVPPNAPEASWRVGSNIKFFKVPANIIIIIIIIIMMSVQSQPFRPHAPETNVLPPTILEPHFFFTPTRRLRTCRSTQHVRTKHFARVEITAPPLRPSLC